jgi:hypothetical protein
MMLADGTGCFGKTIITDNQLQPTNMTCRIYLISFILRDPLSDVRKDRYRLLTHKMEKYRNLHSR